MQRHWLRAIIRMLNTVEEQLVEFFVRTDVPSTATDLRDAKAAIKAALRSLNNAFDDLQQKGK